MTLKGKAIAEQVDFTVINEYTYLGGCGGFNNELNSVRQMQY
jgi:hypothetical protein